MKVIIIDVHVHDVGVSTLLPPGLTPPTTPPHKPAEEELFKPADGGKGSEVTSGGSSGDSGGGSSGESVHSSSHQGSKGSSWLSRGHHQRKLPEQTELYAQLRRMGQAGDADTHRTFGDHDYCALSFGERRKRSAAMLGAILQAQGGGEAVLAPDEHPERDGKGKEGAERLSAAPEAADPLEKQIMTMVMSSSPPSDCQSASATPPVSEEEAECSSASRSPSPILHLCPDSPASKTDSR